MPEELESAQTYTLNTSYTWKDAMMAAIYGYLFDVILQDGTVLTSAREAAMDIQAYLDTITTVPGSILLRTDAGWVGLSAGSPNDVLTVDAVTGYPDWEPSQGGGGGGSASAYALLTPVKPVSSAFSFKGGTGGDCTVTDQADFGFTLSQTQGGGDHIGMLGQAAPSTPWHVDLGMHIDAPLAQSAQFGGIYCRYSGATKLITCHMNTNGSGTVAEVVRYNSPTSFDGRYYSQNTEGMVGTNFAWLRLANDGTNLTWSWSNTGYTFQQMAQASVTDFLASPPDEIGVFVDAIGSGDSLNLNAFHWAVAS